MSIEKKIIIPIQGMHCRSCEILLEDAIKNVSGVSRVTISYRTGDAHIYYADRLNRAEVEGAIVDAGYTVGKEKRPFFVGEKKSIFQFLVFLVLVFSFYFAFQLLHIPLPDASTGNLFAVFVVGLAAGVSTCMALVGGLVLSLSSRYLQNHKTISTSQTIRPHVMFNLGRIFGYAVLGGFLGTLGSIIQPSNGFVGVVTLVVGFFILFLGIKLTGMFPWVDRYAIHIPSGVYRWFGMQKPIERYSDTRAVLLGIGTFFIPCGFTQVMQIYSVASGTFVGGALVMGVFALGTSLGLMGIGWFTALFGEKRKKSFFMFVGVVTILFGLINIFNGNRLLQIVQIPSRERSAIIVDNRFSTEDKQIIKTTYSQVRDIVPNTFSVKKDVPVRLEVRVEDNGSGCMSTIMIPGLYERPEYLEKGKIIIMEFVPIKSGSYPITCAMGVPRGVLRVN